MAGGGESVEGRDCSGNGRIPAVDDTIQIKYQDQAWTTSSRPHPHPLSLPDRGAEVKRLFRYSRVRAFLILIVIVIVIEGVSIKIKIRIRIRIGRPTRVHARLTYTAISCPIAAVRAAR